MQDDLIAASCPPKVGEHVWVRIRGEATFATVLRVAMDGATAYVAIGRSYGQATGHTEEYVQHRSVRCSDIIALIDRPTPKETNNVR